MNPYQTLPWKVILFILSILLGLPVLVLASSPGDLSEKQVIDLLCSGKWHLSYMEIDGQHDDFPPNEAKANWTVFKQDGTHNSEEMGEAYSGTWTYNHETKTLTTDDKDGKVSLVIISIDEHEIQFSLVDQGKKLKVGMKK